MAEVDSDLEILEFAIYRENEAYNFFLALAGRVEEPHIRKVFEDLAAEELEHKEKLELEVMKSGRTISTQLKPPRPADEYILTDDPAPLDMDYKDVLLLGMEKEEASFRTYVNLIANVQNEHSREVLIKLAEEEVRHKMRFENEYNALERK